LSWFVQKFEVNLSEAIYESVEDYPSFAQLFARRLKENVRPIDSKAILVSSVNYFPLFSYRNGEINSLLQLSIDLCLTNYSRLSWKISSKFAASF